MKNLLSLLVVAFGLTATAQAHVCAFMPDYFFEDIMNDPNHTDETKQIANDTLQYTRLLRSQRTNGEGFEADDDDDQFPEEEDPSDQQILQQELANYNEAESVPADPDSVENRKRSPRKSRRQNTSIMRFIHNDNMNCDRTTPGPLVRSETSIAAIDFAANDVFTGFYWVDRLYREEFGRNSIDNRGERYRARVHHCTNYNNAFWDGVGMFFGDGDGVTTYKEAFPMNQDVIGHEVTHGVIQRSNPLHYFSMTGALNEHLADVFGILSRQLRDNSPAATDSWLLGEGINTDGSATRSMKAPGTASSRDRQPANMAQYYYGEQDDYGVHINSGIPNHAFYLFAISNGGMAFNGPPAKIWYNVLTQGQGAFGQYTETFESFAQKTLNAAGSLYGPFTANALRQAWVSVGVLQDENGGF